MPVENSKNRAVKIASKVPQRASAKARRAFADAMAAGMTRADVCRKRGIGQSTYYKWKALWEKSGDIWADGPLPTRAVRLKSLTVKETQEEIGRLSLLHPTYGPKRLAALLGSNHGFRCSTATVHKILKDQKLNTLEQRVDRLHLAQRKGAPLTIEQRRSVTKMDPFVGWRRGEADRAGQVLIQEFIQIDYRSPVNKCIVHIVVDPYDLRAFAIFAARNDTLAASRCLEIALAKFKSMDQKVKRIFVVKGHMLDTGPSGSKYSALLGREGIRNYSEASTKNCRNSLIAAVWKDLRQHLFVENLSACLAHRSDASGLNSLMQKYLDKEYGDGVTAKA